MKKGFVILVLVSALCSCALFGCAPSGKGGNDSDPIEVGGNELPVVPFD